MTSNCRLALYMEVIWNICSLGTHNTFINFAASIFLVLFIHFAKKKYFYLFLNWCDPIPFSVGFHNGGLCLKDRSLVEGLFLKGDLQILCTTNTLAHGVNLPAHTVVIKSTQFLWESNLDITSMKLIYTFSFWHWFLSAATKRKAYM